MLIGVDLHAVGKWTMVRLANIVRVQKRDSFRHLKKRVYRWVGLNNYIIDIIIHTMHITCILPCILQ